MSVPQPFAPPPENHIGAMGDEYAREWWRWHFAGEIAAAKRAAGDCGHQEEDAVEAVRRADALIAALGKE